MGAFGLFKQITGKFAGKGLRRIPGAAPLYRAVYRAARPKGIVEVNVQGLRLALDSRDDGIATPLLVKGEYEPQATRAFLGLLRPGQIVCDIGANVGYHTCLAARAVGPSGRVIAFEPERNNLELLRRNVQANGFTNVEVVPAALSDREGEIDLHCDAVNLGAHSIVRANIFSQGGMQRVKAETLDQFAARTNLPRIDVIKMDVQGAEEKVLTGAAGCLARWRPVLMLEFWPHGLQQVGSDPAAVIERLTTAGYAVKRIQEASEPADIADTPQLIALCGAKGHLDLIGLPAPLRA